MQSNILLQLVIIIVWGLLFYWAILFRSRHAAIASFRFKNLLDTVTTGKNYTLCLITEAILWYFDNNIR